MRGFTVTHELLEECLFVEIAPSQHPLKNKLLNLVEKGLTKIENGTCNICVDDYISIINVSCS